MSKATRNTTRSAKNTVVAEAAENANSNTILPKNPSEPASRAQLALIGKAVKDGKLERFSKEEWTNLTKGQACEIINSLTNGEERMASDRQKEKIRELVCAGFLNRVPYGIYKSLKSEVARKLIYIGKLREEKGEKAQEYVKQEATTSDEKTQSYQKPGNKTCIANISRSAVENVQTVAETLYSMNLPQEVIKDSMTIAEDDIPF